MGSSSTRIQSADLVIVGGGVVGAAVAHYVSAEGVGVVLLERKTLNSGASGTTAGNLHLQGIKPRLEGGGQLGEVESLLPLQRLAATLWRGLENELAADLELRQHGGFMVAETPEEVELLKLKHARERAYGVETELLDGSEARRRLPLLSGKILAASYGVDDGYANPLRVTPAFAASAVRHGARVLTHQRVRAIEPNRPAGYRVLTDRGGWDARWVVNAAGPWAIDVAGLLGIPPFIQPRASQLHVMVSTAPVMRHLVQHVGKRLTAKQVPAGNMIVGGGWPGVLSLDGRCGVLPSSIAGNLELACRILPFLRGQCLLRSWAGPVAAIRDEVPVCGEVSARPGFFVVAGSNGFTLSPVWGLCLRDSILGRKPPIDMAPFRPDRLLA